MIINELYQNIFENIHRPTVIVHGCNMKGVMGAGIAYAMKAKYPEMFKEYQNICHTGKATLGGVYFYKVDDNLVIANAFTQPGFGDAKEEAITKALQIVSDAFVSEVDLRVVRIGCGLGGLNWADVKPIINEDKGRWTIYEIKK